MTDISPEDALPSMMDGVSVITPLASAEQLLRDYCGWHVAPILTQTIYVDSPGARHLALPTLKLRELISVEVDGQAIDVDKVQWSESGILYFPGNGFWPSGLRNVRVTMRHGYNPTEIAWIVQQIAKRVENTPGAGHISRVTMGAQSVTYNETAGVTGLLDREKEALVRYKLDRKVF